MTKKVVKKIKKASYGFNLIEILVTIGLISIIVTSSYVVFTRFNRQQAISTAYENLKNTLNEAKSNASSQVVKDCTNILVGYQISFFTDPSRYSLYEICQVPGESPTAIIPPVKTITLPEGITLDYSRPQDFVRFLILSNNVLNSGRITLTNGNASQNKIIDVSPEGVIE